MLDLLGGYGDSGRLHSPPLPCTRSLAKTGHTFSFFFDFSCWRSLFLLLPVEKRPKRPARVFRRSPDGPFLFLFCLFSPSVAVMLLRLENVSGSWVLHRWGRIVFSDVEKWIDEARQGNQEALGRLLAMCRHYLLLIANQNLSPALAAKVAPSDVVQDTLMEAGRHFVRFSGSSEEELLAWLRGILRNNVADTHRRYNTEQRRVNREVPLEEYKEDELLQGMSSPTDSPSKQAQAHEQVDQLESALQQLPEHYRQVLRMHTMEGLTFEQVAAKLGGSADAVRKLWGRAIEELAKHLDATL